MPDAAARPVLDLAHAETRADLIEAWNPYLVAPIALQTAAYTMALLTPGPLGQPTTQAQHAYAALHQRRKEQLLARGGPHIRAVLGEAALRAGEPTVLHDQLARLLALPPSITVQVLPFRVNFQGRAPFMLLRTPDGRSVYLEGDSEALETAPAVVRQFRERMDCLTARALSPAASLDFIRGLAERA
jgi:hypothetical protein